MPQRKPQLQETAASSKQREIPPQVTWDRKGVNHPRKQQQQAENFGRKLR